MLFPRIELTMCVKSESDVTFFVPINSVEIFRALGFLWPKYNLFELQPGAVKSQNDEFNLVDKA